MEDVAQIVQVEVAEEGVGGASVSISSVARKSSDKGCQQGAQVVGVGGPCVSSTRAATVLPEE